MKEYKRQRKLGREKFFCSLSCAATYSNKNRDNVTNASQEHMKKMQRRAKEVNTSIFPQYNYYITKARARTIVKGWEKHNIDNEYLHDLWQECENKCCYSGLPMKLAGTTNDIFEMASLDRIDSSKGYEKGNVQFCIAALNLAKSSRTDQDFRTFLQKLSV